MRKRVTKRILCWLLTAAVLLLPLAAAGETYPAPEELRVGFAGLDGYHTRDENGNLGGYGYEYLQHLAVYGNWTYTYVGYGATWEEMLDLLARGEIDLLAPALKTADRQQEFDFTEHPAGYATAVLTARAEDTDYAVGDYASWSGIRVGLLRGSSQNDQLADFAAEQGFTYRPVYYDALADLQTALNLGADIDAILTTSLRTTTGERILTEFGSSPFYIIVKKGDAALLDKLNAAQEQMELCEPTLLSALSDRHYTREMGGIAYTAAERAYLASMEGKTLTAVITPDNAPLSSFDGGQAVGMLSEIAEQILSRTGLTVRITEAENQVAYRALRNNADLCLDMSGDYSAAERAGYKLCGTYLNSNIARVTAAGFSGETRTVGTVAGSAVAEQYIKTLPDNIRVVSYATTQDAVKAVRAGRVDAAYLPERTAALAVQQDETNRLTYTRIYGTDISFCIGVRSDHNALLCSVIAKATAGVSEAAVSRVVQKHTAAYVKPFSAVGFLYSYPLAVVGALTGLALIVIALVLWQQRKKRLAEKQRQEDKAQHRDELQYMAEHDPLTGVFNERQFLRKTEDLLRAHPDRRFLMARLDVNKFQLVNACFGTAEGDRVLVFLAETVGKYVKAHAPGAYGRLTGDVFALCCPYSGPADGTELMQWIQDEVRRYPLAFQLVLTFGLYVIADADLPASTMLDRAALAAKACKGNYAKPFAYYTDSIGAEIEREQALVSDMREALEQQQFFVRIQPVYDLRTGKTAGGEALVRWNHPHSGELLPGAFVPVFEKNGLITQMDAFVWDAVCRQLRAWLDGGVTPAPVSVNVSRVNLYNPNLVEELTALVERYALPPRLLQLELTESAYADNPQMMKQTTARLRDSGFTILMDDFGNGYSSLNILKDIEVDILKIDMRFLSQSDIAGRGENIVASVVRMAKWLGLPVIAEGAETKEQVEFLRSISCEYAQGFYFSEALDPAVYAEITGEDKTPDAAAVDADGIWTANTQMERLFSGALNAAGLYEYDAEQRELVCLRVNGAFNDVFGYQPSYRANAAPLDNTVGDYRSTVLDAVETAVETRSVAQCVYLRRVSGGKNIWVDLKINYLGKSGSKYILMGSFFDISGYKEIEQELTRFRSAAGDGSGQVRTLLVVDDQLINREILKKIFTPAFSVLEAANGQEALDLLHDGQCGQVDVILLDMVMPVMDGETFLRIKREDKDIEGIPVIIVTADDSAEKQINMLAMGAHDYIVKPLIPDVVKRRVNNAIESSNRFRTILREYQDVVEQAKADPLTRVFNRAAAEQMITDILARESQLLHAMVMIDLDNFKNINDTYGHSYGDMVLMEFGAKLNGFFRAGDIVARMGGDEFCVFMRNVRTAYAAQDKCQELCRTVRKLAIGGELVRVTCSIGVAISTPDSTFGELYRQADSALYASKRGSKDRSTVYREGK